MKLYQVLLAAFQLAWVFALRDFQLTREHNGVCLKVDSAGDNTSITLDFTATDKYHRTEIPVIVFNYLDLAKVKNVPNFVEFLNETYSNKEENSSIVAYGERIQFNLIPSEGEEELPKSFAFAPVAVFGEADDLQFEPEHDDVPPPFLTYPVPEAGVYCIYIPRYLWQNDDGDLNLFPRPFEAVVSVNNEPLPYGVEEDIFLNSKLFGGLGIVTLLLYFFHNGSETPIVPKLIWSVFALYFVYYGGLFFLDVVVLFGAPTGFLLPLIESYTRLEGLVLDNYLRLVVFSVYIGHGVIYDYTLNLGGIHSRFTAPKWTFRIVAFLVISYMATLAMNHIMVHKFNPEVVAVNINKVSFEVLSRSIIFKSSYHHEVVSKALRSKIDLIRGISLTNVGISLASFIFSFHKSISIIREIGRNLKKEDSTFLTHDKRRDDKSKLSRPLKRSLVLHLFIYKILVMPTVLNLFLQPVDFFGHFDIAECLDRIHPIISKATIIKRTIILSELVVLWLIWGYGENGLKESDIIEEAETEEVTVDTKVSEAVEEVEEVELLEENKGIESKD
ncbi:uncharacterized protein CANTADRAFT_25375 [Suhomyces tanzawaensis NRRL Y-17324]|uniref:Uncharacterized protein n=1 Tax=Suhomyces tanzawaensis NRRL Y-17324 TaxID=984487 RepID=A0A1E4SNM7_9ASCO|nr:uncharacterized protein CANTADRAFT_25375 [Suhomyces tanzawaensis NRRL Y-17324]ODV81130.1 hypothetical protein CANTADRAFT_25375 [Suhomyces tanzawaensis NRRL Y-17324]